MNRRRWIKLSSIGTVCMMAGCRGYQFGHVIQTGSPNLVGSHKAGAEVFDPLVAESVSKLLARQQGPFAYASYDPTGMPCKKRICFVGIENKSAEELGDFKDQLYQQIDIQIIQSDVFEPLSRRVVDAALQETRLRPESLLVPNNMRLFTTVLQRQSQPVDYLLFATLTSGTTTRNTSSQRDYLLTLELVNVNDGTSDKQSAEIRKGYHKSPVGKWWHFNPFRS